MPTPCGDGVPLNIAPRPCVAPGPGCGLGPPPAAPHPSRCTSPGRGSAPLGERSHRCPRTQGGSRATTQKRHRRHLSRPRAPHPETSAVWIPGPGPQDVTRSPQPAGHTLCSPVPAAAAQSPGPFPQARSEVPVTSWWRLQLSVGAALSLAWLSGKYPGVRIKVLCPSLSSSPPSFHLSFLPSLLLPFNTFIIIRVSMWLINSPCSWSKQRILDLPLPTSRLSLRRASLDPGDPTRSSGPPERNESFSK